MSEVRIVDWDEYHPFVPIHPKPPASLTPAEARESFAQFMETREERVRQFRHLLNMYGIESSSDDATAVERINNWYCQAVRPSGDLPDRMETLWYAVAHDFAVVLGETLIAQAPWLHWKLLTAPKRALDFQQAVVSGFRRDPKWWYEPRGIIADVGLAMTMKLDPSPTGLIPRGFRYALEAALTGPGSAS